VVREEHAPIDPRPLKYHRKLDFQERCVCDSEALISVGSGSYGYLIQISAIRHEQPQLGMEPAGQFLEPCFIPSIQSSIQGDHQPESRSPPKFRNCFLFDRDIGVSALNWNILPEISQKPIFTTLSSTEIARDSVTH
jgi:hypothetical protein